MKRLLYLLIVTTTLVSCSKYDGTDHYSPSPSYVSTYLKDYLLYISNDIVTDCLLELESALKMDKEGSMAKYFYLSDGTSLSTDGSVWTVNRDGALKGATITKIAGVAAWEFDYDGDFAFGECKFPTKFKLRAAAVDPTADGHRDWNVELNGTRTEEDGYVCLFNHEEANIKYTAAEPEGSSWNAYGYLKMEVQKGGVRVDALIMELRGGISSISITHI